MKSSLLPQSGDCHKTGLKNIKAPANASLYKPWVGYDYLELMVLPFAEVMTFQRHGSRPRFLNFF